MIKTQKIIEEKLNLIRESVDACAILLIGNPNGHDIDLLVITPEKGQYEREVFPFKEMLFDVSYAPKDLFEGGYPFLNRMLKNFTVLYLKDEDTNAWLQKQTERKAGLLSKTQINYYRFILHDQYTDILLRLDDEATSQFLINRLLQKTLEACFALNSLDLPADKKLINLLTPELRMKAGRILKEQDLPKRLDYIKEMIDDVLKPFGGILEYWKKSEYPLL